MSDTHHFKETVNGGVISNISANATVTGVWAMQLTDFPIFQQFKNCFEFVRLNACVIEYLPKYNMQLNLTSNATGNPEQISTTGTYVTAIDQVPFSVVIGSTSTMVGWSNDASNTSGTTSPAPYTSSSISVGYVRGIQNSREKELYKKTVQKFMPAFYTPVLGGDGPSTFTSVAWQRNVKKWVTTTIGQTGGNLGVTSGNGPLYYGPVLALDINEPTEATLPLFDVRLKYSMSFKRLKGV